MYSPNSVTEGVELFEKFDGTASESGYDARAHVDFHHREEIWKSLSVGYQSIQSAGGVEDPNSSFGVPDIFCV